jgi:hypothetical protein
MSKRRLWKKSTNAQGKEPFIVRDHMLTRTEREHGEGSRINKWLELADKILNRDDDDPAPSAA